MRKLDTKWRCYNIAHNEHYIATIGSGVSIWDRKTLELIHHFQGFHCLHGGLFVGDDILMVYTGEQKIFFLKISEKRVEWAVPRPREIRAGGDLRCCLIPGTQTVAYIADARDNFPDKYLLLVDYSARTVSAHLVEGFEGGAVNSLVYTKEAGLTFRASYYKGDKIYQVDETGKAITVYAKSIRNPWIEYTGHYAFVEHHVRELPEAKVFQLQYDAENNALKAAQPFRIPLTLRLSKEYGTHPRTWDLPEISWIDEASGLLVTTDRYSEDCWIGIYDFLNKKKLAEYRNDKVWCATLLDNRLLIGCLSGFYVVENAIPMAESTL